MTFISGLRSMLTRGSRRPWTSTSSCHRSDLSWSGVSRKYLMKALSASSLSILVIMSPPLRTLMLGSLATNIILFSFLENSSKKGHPCILRSLRPENFLSFSTSSQLLILVMETLRLCSAVGMLSMSSRCGNDPIGHSAKLRNCKLSTESMSVIEMFLLFLMTSPGALGQKVQWHWVKIRDWIAWQE